MQPIPGTYFADQNLINKSPGLMIPGMTMSGGLEVLRNLDGFGVQQLQNIIEIITDYDVNNVYTITNNLNQQILIAKEESSCCWRVFCKESRKFTIHVFDNTNQELFKVTREFICCGGCCGDCTAYTAVVQTPDNRVLGYVKQNGCCILPRFEIQDESTNTVLNIEGPCCVLKGPCCTEGTRFQLLTSDSSQQVGEIFREYGGFCTECFTRADRFNAKFPIDLNVNSKATIIAAIFLLDFMYFEGEPPGKNNNN